RFAFLIFALSLTAACSSSSPSTTSPTSGTPVAIVAGASTLTTTAFSPNPVSVPVGTTVTWMNNDNVTHTSVANNGNWNSGSIAPGGTFSMTFNTTGSFPYHCSIHPGMVATVNVQ